MSAAKILAGIIVNICVWIIVLRGIIRTSMIFTSIVVDLCIRIIVIGVCIHAAKFIAFILLAKVYSMIRREMAQSGTIQALHV